MRDTTKAPCPFGRAPTRTNFFWLPRSSKNGRRKSKWKERLLVHCGYVVALPLTVKKLYLVVHSEEAKMTKITTLIFDVDDSE